MYVTETETCCSILEIGDLDTLNGDVTKENLIDAIKDSIDWFDEIEDLNEVPQVYIATTNPEQTEAAALLKSLGFTSKKVQGRHRNFRGNTKYLTFWMKTTQFPEIKKWIQEERKRVLRDD